MLVVPLVVLRYSLPHRGLLLEPLCVVQLGADTVHLLGELGALVGGAGLLLALAFVGVEATTVKLAVTLHVLVLGHG